MTSKLDQLRSMTTVVSDTGDIDSIKAFKPIDCTTNPTLILKAAQMPAYASLLDEAIAWGRKNKADTSQIADHLAVSFGCALSKIIPGRVSTEVNADLSFDTGKTVAKARDLIADYQRRGVARERILIKIAATWEGIQAAKILQQEKIDCNLTLVFSLTQAIACAEAGVFLISPFVGRILDWHVKNTGQSFTAETDPGVVSVRAIYTYFKAHAIKTIVMGASFRNIGEIEALAGCDRLTIAPNLLQQLALDETPLARVLDPEKIAFQAAIPAPFLEQAFRWQMNEDAMASEKLSESIRLFAHDLRSLRELLDKRMSA